MVITREWLRQHMQKGFTTAQKIILQQAGVATFDDMRVGGWPDRLVGKVLSDAQATAFERAREQLTPRGIRSRERRAERTPQAPQALDMVRQLDEALHGKAWARSSSPEQVWRELLGEVRMLVESAQLENAR